MCPLLDSDRDEVNRLVEERVRQMLRGNVAATDMKPRSLPMDRLAISGTKGSIPVDNGKTSIWLPPGTSGRKLVADSSSANGVAFEQESISQMIRTGTLVYTLNAWQPITGWSADKDTNTAVLACDTTNSRINITRPGVYEVSASVGWANPGVPVWIGVRLYNSIGNRFRYNSFYWENSSAGLTPSIHLSPVEITFGAGDWVAMEVYSHILGGGAGAYNVGAIFSQYDTQLRLQYKAT